MAAMLFFVSYCNFRQVPVYTVFHLLISETVKFPFLRVSFWYFRTVALKWSPDFDFFFLTCQEKFKLSCWAVGEDPLEETWCLVWFAFSLSRRAGVEIVWVRSNQDGPGGRPQEAHQRRVAVLSARPCPHEKGQRFRGRLRWQPLWPFELSRYDILSEFLLRRKKQKVFTF